MVEDFDSRLVGGQSHIGHYDLLNTSRLSKPRAREPLGTDDKDKVADPSFFQSCVDNVLRLERMKGDVLKETYRSNDIRQDKL